MKIRLENHAFAAAVTAGYTIFSGIWVIFSDRMLARIADAPTMVELETVKGLFFVFVSSTVLFVVLRHVPKGRIEAPELRQGLSRTPLVALAVAMITILAISYVTYRAEVTRQRQEGLAKLETLAMLEATNLSSWLVERRADGRALAEDEEFRESVSRWLETGAEEDRRRIETHLVTTRRLGDFAAVALIAPSGAALLGDAATAADRAIGGEALRRALRWETTFVDLHHRDDQTLHMGFLAPIRGVGSRSDEIVAIATLDLRPLDHLDRLLVTPPGLPSSIETVLARSEGDALVRLMARSKDGIRLLDPQHSSIDEALPTAPRIAAGEWSMAGVDRRGVDVLVAASRVVGADWILFSKIDEADAVGDLRRLALAAGVSLSVALVACLGIGYFLWQRQRLRTALHAMRQQMLTDAAEDRYRATFEQVAIGIAHVSLDGRWIRFNSTFAAITGFSAERLVTLPVSEVFHPDERAEVTASMARLARGEVNHLVTERRIVRADGVTALVRIAVTVVNDHSETGSYLVAVVEDISDRRAIEDALRTSEERFDLAMRGANDGLWDWNLDTGSIYYSPRWKAMLGYGPNEIADRIESHRALVHPDDVEEADAQTRDFLEGRCGTYLCEFRMRAKTGEWRHILSRAFVVRDASGRATRMVGTHVDITDRKRDEVELRRAAAVFTNTQEGVVITDPHGTIVEVNPAFTTITGWARERAIGRKMSILNSGRQDAAFFRALWKALAEVGHWQGEIWNCRRDGEIYPQWLTISTVRDASGNVTHRLGTFTDIGPLKMSEARLTHLALHDHLTDLPNRTLLLERVEQAIEQARVDGTTGAVLFLDLDRFKTVNDSLGHAAGDELLYQVAMRLRDVLPEGATLARMGGDEFIGLLPRVADADAVAEVARSWVERLNGGFLLSDGREIWVSGSIGISLFPADGVVADELIQHADAALYASKADGGNTHHFYGAAMTAAASRRLNLEAGLRRALEFGEFELHYQPLVSMADGRAHGVEALIRWRDPSGGLIAPDAFLPVAQETGLILPIGEWVLRTACRQMKAWIDAGLPLDTLAVNLSPREFKRTDIPELLAAVLEETGLAAARLEIEITEGALMEQGRATDQKLADLKARGVRLSVDDFGTGYSSLSYLRRMPIDKLKIDRSFVSEIPRDATSLAITASIVALARTLGLEVLAEGVETDEQFEALRTLGCDTAQGFLFSRALPAAEIPLFLTGRADFGITPAPPTARVVG